MRGKHTQPEARRHSCPCPFHRRACTGIRRLVGANPPDSHQENQPTADQLSQQTGNGRSPRRIRHAYCARAPRACAAIVHVQLRRTRKRSISAQDRRRRLAHAIRQHYRQGEQTTPLPTVAIHARRVALANRRTGHTRASVPQPVSPDYDALGHPCAGEALRRPCSHRDAVTGWQERASARHSAHDCLVAAPGRSRHQHNTRLAWTRFADDDQYLRRDQSGNKGPGVGGM